MSQGRKTKIVGIINCSPDSFSGDGVLGEKAIRHGLKLISEGADILDIGGVSTRPGAKPVALKEELARVIPVIKGLSKKTRIPLSIDTTQLEVVRQSLDLGVAIVNYIKGINPAASLLKLVSSYQAGIILMHSRGTPRTMQKKIHYKDIMAEITSLLAISVEKCLDMNIKRDRIILDPGIGFAKSVEGNLTIIDQLPLLATLKLPILIGTSRKSFIGKVLGDEMRDRLMGTSASVAVAITRGAEYVRVHDVKAIKDVVLTTDAILNHHA